jgi:thiol-disulfide isomerase/thioredoxin
MMRKLPLTIAAGMIGAIGLAGAAFADPAPKLPYTKMADLPIVSMQVYDEKASADQLVDDAMAKAKKSHKLLLIDEGGNWCPDCVVLHNLMLVPAMQKFMDAHYVVAMVDVGKFDRNPQIAARYGYTERLKGVPTILVVNPATNKVINGDYLARWTDPQQVSQR